MRHKMLILLGLLSVILLYGCTQFFPLVVTVTPESGYPTMDRGGLRVLFEVEGASGNIEADFGDGETGMDLGNRFSHVYASAGTFTARVSCGNRYVTARIEVLDDPPFIAPPFWTQGPIVEWHDLVFFNPNRGEAGCDIGGNPLLTSGAYDPNGDSIEVRLNCLNEDGEQESLFDKHYNRINGQWLGPQADGYLPLIVWIAGYTGAVRPFPFVTPFSCEPCPPPEDPCPSDSCRDVVFTFEARDCWGLVSQIIFTICVEGGPCPG